MPIEPPPLVLEALTAWHSDIVARLRTLFEEYGLQYPVDRITTSPWRELVMKMAIEHHSAFRIAIDLQAVKLPSQKKWDVVIRQGLMDDHVHYAEQLDKATGKWEQVRRDVGLPVDEAAKQLRRALLNRPSLEHLANATSSMATAYSRSRHAHPLGDLLIPYIDYFRTVAGIQYVAAGLSVTDLHTSLIGNKLIEASASKALAVRMYHASR